MTEDKKTVSIDIEDLHGCLPAGSVKAQIDSAEIKPTKARTGEILALMMTVISSTRAGAKLFCNIIISHPKEGAVYYGRKLLKSLLDAVGIDTSSGEVDLNPAALVGKTVIADVIVKDSKDWGKQNEVISFKACPSEDASEEDTDSGSIPF